MPEAPVIPLTTRLVTPRLVLRAPRPSDVPELRRVLRKNEEHLRPWSPKPPPGEDATSVTQLARLVLSERRAWRQGTRYVFLPTLRAPGAPIVGRLALSQVARGAFQCAYLGYWIDAELSGKGLMTEAARAVLDFALGPLGLHRVQINVMPTNAPSLRVLEKLGLRREGMALKYLQIAGVWEDHVMHAVTAEDWGR